MKGAGRLRGMAEKHWDRDRMEQGKQAPQGHGETERNDHPDDRGHAQHNRHADHRYPYQELHHATPGSRGFDLAQAAVEELRGAGFKPEFDRDVQEQVSEIEGEVAQWSDAEGAADLRGLAWSSIDNDTSKDLDQIEVAERVPTGIRVHVAIGDVAAAVKKGSPIDEHAQNQTQTIYTAVKNFPMLPLELSAGLTSLNENEDRLAIMMSFTVAPNGEVRGEKGSRARGRNRAQSAYSRVGPWLDAGGTDTKNAVHLRSDSAREHASDDAALTKMAGDSSLPADWLAEQLKFQEEGAEGLQRAGIAAGALDFHKAEAEPVLVDGHIASGG